MNILLTCGETSGEYHASLLVRELKALEPDCRVISLGGKGLVNAGAEVSFPMERYAFMGFSEIVAGIPKILSLERELKALINSGNIDLFIPVDYPGMNLRLARYAAKAGVPVLYFISPQVWAWGGWRIEKMKGTIDRMVVILPFEEDIYRKAGIPVFFAGHPVLDEIPAPGADKSAPDTGGTFEVILFPGSRKQEVSKILPPMIDAACRLKKEFAGARFILGVAPMISREDIDIPDEISDSVEVSRKGLERLSGASLVLAASGTVTLQTAVSGTPMVAVYRSSPLTYFLGRILVRIPHVAMPNVLAGEEIVPELLQGEVTGARIAREAASILKDRERYSSISRNLLGLRDKLKGGGGLGEVAKIAIEMTANGPEK